MKRLMKKLTSIALAGAMVLSLGVSALATDLSSNTKGNASGDGTTEGPLPNNVLLVNMPTSAANTFNMYLDPHGLIQATYGAKYEDNATAATNKFASGTNLYFKNATANADGKTYTDSSDELKIINKSNTPIDVKMTAQVSKNGATFDFAADADTAKAATDKATMYLAILGKNDATEFTKAVADIEDDGEAEIAAPSPKLTDDDGEGSASGFIKDDEITIAWTEDATAEVKAAVIEDLANWNIAFADDTGNGVTATLTAGDFEEASGKDAVQTTSDAEDLTVTFTVGNGDIDVLTISFTYVQSVIASADGENGSIADCKIEFEAGGSGDADSEAELTQTVANIAEAYKENVKTVDGKKVYEYKMTDDYATGGDKADTFKALTFKLTGAINTGKVWDNAFAADKKLGIKVIWDVVANETGTDNSGGNTPSTPTNTAKAPVVTVVTAAAAGGEDAVLKIDMGSGSKAVTSLDRITYTRSNGNVYDLASSNYEFDSNGDGTLKAITYLFNGSDANTHFYFKNAAGEDVQVDVDVRTAGDYTVSE